MLADLRQDLPGLKYNTHGARQLRARGAAFGELVSPPSREHTDKLAWNPSNSFGFSIGDLVAVGTLANNLYGAL